MVYFVMCCWIVYHQFMVHAPRMLMGYGYCCIPNWQSDQLNSTLHAMWLDTLASDKWVNRAFPVAHQHYPTVMADMSLHI